MIHYVSTIIILALYIKIVAHKEKLDPSLTSNVHKVMLLSNIDLYTFGDVTVSIVSLVLLFMNVCIVVVFDSILPQEVNLFLNYLVNYFT